VSSERPVPIYTNLAEFNDRFGEILPQRRETVAFSMRLVR